MRHIYLAILAIVFLSKANAQTVATFDDLNLAPDAIWNGSDLSGSFTSGGFTFFNAFNADWYSWTGFAASTKTDATTPGWSNQYSAITGMGVAGTPGYAVAYPAPISTVTFKDTIVSGLYVTNSAYAYWSMKNGDAFAKKFGGESGNDEDFLLLTIEGFNSAGKSTGKVEYFLADFMYGINSNDYILDTWKWVNLSKLGRISKLEFSLRSSDNGTWGMNTPGYFCIDNLNHEVLTSAPEIQEIQVTVFPNPFTDQITISGLKNQAKVSITDVSGKTIASYTNITNNQSINDLQKLNSGVYFIRIYEGKNQFDTKLIKNSH
ncbi:MAG TPA: PEP-CTERM sorting domain-containing protein [Prolixibacteraceae bacterium]|nr:PEP-CTERM sorting domain-containing protein [Prolixibacteraceae bacterium]